MDLDIRQEIREIVHGLGEKRQRKDTMDTIQSVLFKQMVLIVVQSHKAAIKHKRKEILIKDLIFVLRNHKNTLIRLLRYYLLKENIHKLTAINHSTEQHYKEENNTKKRKISEESKSMDKDIAEATSNFDFNNTLNLDPISSMALMSYYPKIPNHSLEIKKNCIYKQILDAIADLKLNISITNEDDVRNATEARKIRVDELSIVLSPEAYEGFQVCRTRAFHNKLGERLLNKIQETIPWTIKYKSQIEDIFLFLAKETIACLIDRVYENRKYYEANKLKSIDFFDKDNLNSEVKKFDALRVQEITDIITKTWNCSLSDISYFSNKNEAFFDNPLIFD